jgi:mannose-1-phosphate guanylyltransferase
MRWAVILAGGGGKRLWPASRRARPKQFLPLAGTGETLLAATARRLGAVCDRERIAAVFAADHGELVAAELGDLDPANLIAEPEGRDTAAAIGLAAVVIGARDRDAVIGVLPADHYIGDEARFAAAVDDAFAAAEIGSRIATVGVVPTRPETGYGYLEIDQTAEGQPIRGPLVGEIDQTADPVRPVVAFVEKPDAGAARSYLAGGRHLWNAGMFFARADHWRAEIERHLPDTAAGLAAIEAALDDPAAWAAPYVAMPRVSIDVGVMEKTDAVVCVPGDFGWSDVGSWASVAEVHGVDDSGSAHIGDVFSIDGERNIAVADADAVIGLVGVSDLIVVASGKAVLVTTADRAQEVRELVAAIEAGDREDVL